MRQPDTPSNEARRLERIQELALANITQGDEALEKLVTLAADWFQTPIAFITIVQEHQQLFRAQYGVELSVIPRHSAFCRFTILAPELFEVPDTLQDPDFQGNALVVGPPALRYYAGYPLFTADGLALGSLCVADVRPRAPMSTREAALLKNLAELVMLRIDHLRAASFIDQPTGLLNRLKLEEDVGRALREREDIELVAVDVISPRELNDVVKAFGYTFANGFMLDIKRRLLSVLPAQHDLYKVSPTRFGFLLERGPRAAALYDAILHGFDEPIVTLGVPLHLSVGIGVLPLDGERLREQDCLRLVVGAADSARDKGLGWRLYEPAIDLAQQRALAIVSALSLAVHGGNQFSLAYQPKIALDDGRCSGVEALLRWRHPTLGEIPPSEFIPLAEKTALMHPITAWVAAQAIRAAQHWRERGVLLPIAINVSAENLVDERFTDSLLRQLSEAGLPATAISVEFTESALVSNPDAVRAQLEKLRGQGIRIAIDDFGSGYSNWNYLRDLPADTLKIDQSLIREIGSQGHDQLLVRTLIDFAQQAGYEVIAEGIEVDEARALLHQWGCHQGQGYLIARPMSEEALGHWLDSDAER